MDEELSLAVKHLKRSEEAHHSEIIRLEGEVTRGVQERHKLMQKLEEIHVVEDAVKDLYLHMKVQCCLGVCQNKCSGLGMLSRQLHLRTIICKLNASLLGFPAIAHQERTSEAEYSYEQLNNEREILKGQNVLTVLGALHATLKSLWAFKVHNAGEAAPCAVPLKR